MNKISGHWIDLSGGWAATKRDSTIVEITLRTVLKIGSCCLADQLYIYKKCAYYLDYKFGLAIKKAAVKPCHFLPNVALRVPLLYE